MSDWPFDTLVEECRCVYARAHVPEITNNEVVNELKFIVLLSQNLGVNKLVAFYCSRKSLFARSLCVEIERTQNVLAMFACRMARF